MNGDTPSTTALGDGIDRAGVRAWEALAGEHATLPTQAASWALASHEAFAEPPATFGLGEHGFGAAVAPLVRGRRQLELAGAQHAHEPSDLLAAAPAALEELVDRVVRTRWPLLLRRVPGASPTPDALRRALGARGLVRVRQVGGHPAIELGERWQEPGGGLSSSRRSSLRRARRHAERRGEVAVELLAPAPEEVEELLDCAFAIEARSWKGARGTALLQTPAMGAFIKSYAAQTAARGELRLQFLTIDGTRVAMHVALEWRGRIWLLKTGYDEAFADASPGQLLLAESIADAARRGLGCYELLGESSGWTRVWTELERPCVSVAAFPVGSRSGLLAASAARRALRRQTRTEAVRVAHAAARVAADAYVAGPRLADALSAESRYAAAGFETTVGYWDRDHSTAEEVTRTTFATARALRWGSELSIKQPAMAPSDEVLDELLGLCEARRLRLHFDMLAPATADATLAAAARLADRAGITVGCTLAGRWRRSAADAETAIGHRLRVRVVKSEWADPADRARDPRSGFLEVVDALAGRAVHVAIATHDVELAVPAFERLAQAGTPFELQVLHAMDGKAVLAEARRRGVPVRVYVPYGHGRLPYELSDRDTRVAVALVRDVARAALRRPDRRTAPA